MIIVFSKMVNIHHNVSKIVCDDALEKTIETLAHKTALKSLKSVTSARNCSFYNSE